MGSFMKKAMEAYEQQQVFGNVIDAAKITKQRLMDGFKGDSRYNTPKEPPKASEEAIDKAIEETEIYKQAKERILKFQRGQVGYGLDKYPETLNASTWTEIETQHHIIEESIDKLHYEVMRLIQLERKAEKELEEFKKNAVTEETTLYTDGIEYMKIPIGIAKVGNNGHFEEYLDHLKNFEAKHAKGKPLEPKISIHDIPLEHTKLHGYSMNDVEETTKLWKAMNAVSDNAGRDTDGDYEDIHDDSFDALSYSFGQLGSFANSGYTVNDIRKDIGMKPIEAITAKPIETVRLNSTEIKAIADEVIKYLENGKE